ncbi:hypothetical protein LguiA_016686 [Lonicera macranthoides]
MGDESQKWVLMITAQTPTNIAVIKYWGKRDEYLILAINDSISVTLDPDHLCITTTVAVSPSFHQDRMWLNGKCWLTLRIERGGAGEISLLGDRYQNCLREIRSCASDLEDKKKGIKISKKEWEKLRVHIASHNNFPTAAGLASSAAGFACLVCLDKYPPIVYMNDTSHKIIGCVEKWNLSEGTPQVAYTFDTGPNAVLIARNRKTAALLLWRLLFHFPPQSDTDRFQQDVESWTPPPEIKDNITAAQKYRGDVTLSAQDLGEVRFCYAKVRLY